MISDFQRKRFQPNKLWKKKERKKNSLVSEVHSMHAYVRITTFLFGRVYWEDIKKKDAHQVGEFTPFV